MIATLTLALLGAAQEPPIDCANAMAQIEMNICAGRDFERADADLNRLWREIMATARTNDPSLDNGRVEGDDRTEQASLRDAQRAWVTFRDAHCTWEGFSERGGSMEPMVFESCRAQLTRDRIAQLSGPQVEH